MCTVGCTEGALSGCTKAESLRTKWYTLSKTKTCRIITEVFHFYATSFIFCLLLRTFFKTVGELLHLLTVHPKFIFRGALNCSRKYVFYAISQKLDKKLREKAGYHVCLNGIDQFYKNFFYLHGTSFVIWENSPVIHLWSPTFILFSRNTSDYFYLLKIIIKVVFFGNILTKR